MVRTSGLYDYEMLYVKIQLWQHNIVDTNKLANLQKCSLPGQETTLFSSNNISRSVIILAYLATGCIYLPMVRQ